MGDPYTADEPITIPGQIESYTVTTNEETGVQTQTANYGEDVELPGIAGATISGSGEGGFQTGEQGMMVKKKDMKAEKGMMMKKFHEGGFSVMDPADFVKMLRDNRKK